MTLTPRIDNIQAQAVRNVIINGNFDLWQRGIGPLTINAYLADRFQRDKSSAPAWAWSQSTDTPSFAESNFESEFSLLMEADGTGSPGAAEYAQANYKVEGLDLVPILGRRILLSFWAKTNKIGVYCVSFQNNARDRSYIAEYTMDSANTWEKKVITLDLDNVGTWLINNLVGLRVQWMFHAGVDLVDTADMWHTSDVRTTSNQVNFFDSASNEFRLSQVMLYSVEDDFDETIDVPFQRAGKNFQEEVAFAKRYYTQTGVPGNIKGSGRFPVGRMGAHNGATNIWIPFETEMRALPTVFVDTSGTSSGLNDGGSVAENAHTQGFSYRVAPNASSWSTGLPYSADAEL